MNLLDLAKQIGLYPKFASNTQGGEYHSSCPVCGGNDRFVIQPNKLQKNCTGYYFCRQCGKRGDSIQFYIDFLNVPYNEALKQIGITKNINNAPRFIYNKKQYTKANMVNVPNDLWINKAAQFISTAHKQLLKDPAVLNMLIQRGLSKEAIIKYQLGLNLTDTLISPAEWGLTLDPKENGLPRQLWIPKGIVIPTFDKSKPLRIKIRRSNWKKDDKLPKYIEITGSASGLNVIGNTEHSILIVVESELDAYALHYQVEDFAFAVAVGSNVKNPDNYTDYLVKQKKLLLICYDNDEAGLKMLDKWSAIYSHAKGYPTPFGKDIGEAVKQGLDIRSWILKSHNWNQDQLIIDWVIEYIKSRKIHRHIYKNLEREIALGPTSKRALTSELQNGLILMKNLIEQGNKS